VNELGYYDAKFEKVLFPEINIFEKEKFQFKEFNLIEYFLSAFDYMSHLKG
jgi:hypothetical protein